MKKRLVIVDDHESIRQMLALVLQANQGIEVVGEAGTGLEAMEVCRRTRPDIVILELLLPELCGTEVLRRLRSRRPATRVLIYSRAAHEPVLTAALREHPHGFVQKGNSLATLQEALRVVMAGGTYLAPLSLTRSCLTETTHELTPRESEILQMIAEGRSSKQMAGRLNVAVKTVENHRTHLMEKLDLHNVAALTRFAIRAGLVAP